jgi:integrase
MTKTPSAPRRALPHLHRDRHGTYYFRATIAGRTLRRSLRTKDKSLATMLASKLNWEWNMSKRSSEPTVADIIKAFKKDGREFDAEFPDGTKLTGINTDDDLRRAKELMLARIEAIGPVERELAPLRPEHRQPTRPRPPKGAFSKATKAYLAEKALNSSQKGREDKVATYTAFATQFSDPDLAAIDKPMAVEFKQALLKTGAGASRINTKIGQLSELFKWAIGNGLADDNPFDGIRIGKKHELAKDVESYEPFTAEELGSIFAPENWARYTMKGRPHYHWLPFLLLYSGARPDELAGIRLDNIRREQGIDYFALKKAKNSNSIRKVPFHRSVRESGFMAYLEQRRKDDPAGQLFPMLKPSKNGYAKNVSRRFNESYLPSLRIDDPTHRLYSFRSNFITRLSECNVNAAMVMALVGHFEQTAVDLSSPHFKNYQGAKLIGALREAIDELDVKLPMVF